MEYNFLKVERNEGVTVMKISAPKSLNALNSTILKEIDDFIGSLDATTRVLIVTGDGEKSFVAGADISEMAHLDEPQGFEFGRLGAQVFRRIETLPIPVIASASRQTRLNSASLRSVWASSRASRVLIACPNSSDRAMPRR